MLRRLAVVFAVTATAMGVALPQASATSTIQLGRIQYNAPGTDTTSNVNGEYVVIKNLGSRGVSLTGWTLRDAQNHVYKFGTFTLGGGKTVVVHTGKGANTSTVRYWGLGWHVWNNTGDTAYLRNSAGVLADTCAWTSSGTGYKYC